MSKKKKSRYTDNGTKVVNVGEKIEFNKTEEENHMGSEWFYLNDITWFMTTDGRIVTPVKGVVKHLGRPRGYVGPSDAFAPNDGCRVMRVSDAEQSIVDAAPFGKCYEKEALESLWEKLNGHGVSDEKQAESEDQKSCTDDENAPSEEAQFVNCQKFSEDLDETKFDGAKNG